MTPQPAQSGCFFMLARLLRASQAVQQRFLMRIDTVPVLKSQFFPCQCGIPDGHGRE
jgi:hypothetical protein